MSRIRGRIACMVASLLLPLSAVAGAASEAVRGDGIPAEQIFGAVVGVRAEIAGDARTAKTLGTEREGSGIVIDDRGHVLTIGYLVLEARSAEVVIDGKGHPAQVVGYDHETGYGLLRAGDPLPLRPIELGESAKLAAGDPVLAVSGLQGLGVTAAKVSDRREFAGAWEYLIADAIFTVPPHPAFGGAALIDRNGRLVGIGSLIVGDADGGEAASPGNMFVPIDLVKPILDDLISGGRRTGAARPWLGLYLREIEGRVFVFDVAAGGPAEAAGLERGDVVIGVAGRRIGGLADLLRRVRSQGDAGVEVPLDVVRRGDVELSIQRIGVRSRDRHDWLRLTRAP